MTDQPGDTQPEELTPLNEQGAVPQIENEDRAPSIAPEPDVIPPEAKTPAAAEAPADPRAARMEQLAESNRARVTGELEQVREVTTEIPPAPAPEPAVVPERMIKLKVRGEVVELPESEVIARAQKVDAADDYLRESRQLLEDAKKVSRAEPAPAAQPAPAPEPKVDRIALAIESIQTGADPAEAQRLLDEEIDARAASAAERAVANREIRGQAENFDADFSAGFVAVASEFPELAQNPIATNVVVSMAGGMEGELIAQFLAGTDEPTKSAFAQSGITAEGVKRYSPQDAHALYRDMYLKGYALQHKPSAIIRAAGKTVAEWRPGNTQPAPVPQPVTPQPVSIDRSARKDGLQQPERTSIPRAPAGKPAPTTEPQRAAAVREEMRAARRAGAAR